MRYCSLSMTKSAPLPIMRSIIDRQKRARFAALDWQTVALSCIGSPISTSCRGTRQRGMSVSASTACAASSTRTVSMQPCSVRCMPGRPAQLSVQKTASAVLSCSLSSSGASPHRSRRESSASRASRSPSPPRLSASLLLPLLELPPPPPPPQALPAPASARMDCSCLLVRGWFFRSLRPSRSKAWGAQRRSPSSASTAPGSAAGSAAARRASSRVCCTRVCTKAARSGPASGTRSSTPTRQTGAPAPSAVRRRPPSATCTAPLLGPQSRIRPRSSPGRRRERSRSRATTVCVFPVPGGPCSRWQRFWRPPGANTRLTASRCSGLSACSGASSPGGGAGASPGGSSRPLSSESEKTRRVGSGRPMTCLMNGGRGARQQAVHMRRSVTMSSSGRSCAA
mmetsp:Transcript_67577/g.213838  ORF Transcript_67577/g.213838 Transcript_67577/m.213838 type:complete len:397 (+) Transcript_67577:712-1902(+)